MSRFRGQAPQMPPPALQPGQVRRKTRAYRNEDAAQAITRARESFIWYGAVLCRPWRVGEWWLWTCDERRLAALEAVAT